MTIIHTRSLSGRLTALVVGVVVTFGILTFTQPNMADEPAAVYPPTATLDAVQTVIDAAPKSHPRLYATQADFDALRAKVQSDPTYTDVAKAIVHLADLLLDTPPIKYEKQGRRLLDQSRRCVRRTGTLAMAYQLTGEKKYAERCKQEMLTAARFPDWNPSHFLDVGEMTFALAIGYDWTFDQLSDDERKEIRTAIVEKGVTQPFTTNNKGWVRASNNWGQVCHGGLTAGALAILEDEPELAAKTVHNAIQNVTRSMAAFAPNGSYPEGPGYWSYGTSYNVLLIDAMESVLGTDFGLQQAPGFSETGQYLGLVTGPSGESFNYADGGSGRGFEPTLLWFAQRYDRPDWLLGEAARLKKTLESSLRSSSGSSSSGRLFPFTLLWMDDSLGDDVEIKMPLNWSSEGHSPITIHRSSWNDPNMTFVGVKAGTPSSNHGHMDIGSFVLDADGVRWAKDLGAEGYYGIESRGMNLWDRNQDSDRWTIFRQMNHSHNTLVIDDQLQLAAKHGNIVEFSDDPDHAYTIIDMSEVYGNQAESVQRGVMLLPTGEVLIRDELSGLKPGSSVRWGMLTPGEPEKTDGTTALLKQGDAQLAMKILTPESGKWTVIDTEKPRNEWDSPNRGTCMMAIETAVPASGELTIAVVMRPGSYQPGDKPYPDLSRSLDQWSE